MIDREHYEVVEREKLVKFIHQIQTSLDLPNYVNDNVTNFKLRKQFAELTRMAAHRLQGKISSKYR